MNQKQFVQFIKDFYDKNLKIVEAKNKDYAGDDTFKAFKLTEAIGNTTVEEGLLVRMSDKLSRISTLLKKKQHVKDETIEDTLADLANYAAILAAYMSQKPQNDCEACDNAPTFEQYSEEKKPDMLTREDFDVKGAINNITEVINNAPQYMQFKGTETSANQIRKAIPFLRDKTIQYSMIPQRVLKFAFVDETFIVVANDYVRIDYMKEKIDIVTLRDYNKLMEKNG